VAIEGHSGEPEQAHGLSPVTPPCGSAYAFSFSKAAIWEEENDFSFSRPEATDVVEVELPAGTVVESFRLISF
jgi:hypothetical protein